MFQHHSPQLRQQISRHLQAFEVNSQSDPALKRAAVALTVVAGDGGAPALVLTRRASRLRSHAGQWALPGGRLDDGENVIDAALRELREEVNLMPPESAVLGHLDDYPTRSGYLISPVVIWLDDISAMAANPGEVASIHLIPFEELNRADSPQFVAGSMEGRPIIQILLHETRVHAPTAAVLYQFREVALMGKSTRVEHYDQPEWAWR